jgi:hypothetical protein
LSGGALQLDTQVAVPKPPPGDQAPAFGAEQETVFSRLKKAEERNIVDKAFPLMEAKWPYNFVPVCWENPAAADENERGWVHQAVARTWEKQSGLRFTEKWEPCAGNNQGVRIRIADTGPHVKFLGKFLNGLPDGMVLNFTFATWSSSCRANDAQRRRCIESIGVHEFGHAIGFAHEQNRPDTPGECSLQRQGSQGDTISITPWDLHSVMNYCNPVYNNDGTLSEFDIKAVRYIYGDPR